MRTEISIRCYYPGKPDNYTQHYPEIKLSELPKWIKAYQYTHPTMQSMSIKMWFKEDEEK